MKKLLLLIALCCTLGAFTACNDDDDNISLDDYQTWRVQNEQWVRDQQARTNPDGTPYFEAVFPAWNPGIFVLMHWFNDRSETAGNLTPLYTSTVDVRYNGYNCEGERFDSSSTTNAYGRLGVQRFQCNAVIQGWSVALENMHVGDTVEIVIPNAAAYGTSYLSEMIPPYSALRFNVRLEDIYMYEKN